MLRASFIGLAVGVGTGVLLITYLGPNPDHSRLSAHTDISAA